MTDNFKTFFDEVLWIIPARSGSKSIPNKNIKLLGDLPLFVHRLKSIEKYANHENIIFSSDSSEYCSLADSYKIGKSVIRPSYLATDLANSMDVISYHMKEHLINHAQPKYVGLLEPTSPFIESKQLIDALISLDSNNDATSIVAVRENRPHMKFIQSESKYLDVISKNILELQSLARQEFEKCITPSGGFYISKWADFEKNKTFYTSKCLGHLVEGPSELEIDEPIDWDFAEFLYEKQIKKITKWNKN